MPLMNLRTNLAEVKSTKAILEALSLNLANATGKPEAYVMTMLEIGVPMTFAGSAKPCAYLEVKSIGALKPKEMSSKFSLLIEEMLGIPKERIYISFDDVPASMWGWNANTFG